MPVLNPYLKISIEKLEDIQNKVTRLVLVLRKNEYEKGYKILRLTTLEIRRKKEDLRHLYKILNGLDHIAWNSSPETRMVKLQGTL